MSPLLLFDDWPSAGFSADAAKISAVKLDRNILRLQVSYIGGCAEHRFVLEAWSGFLMSNPPQGELYLSHDSDGDSCQKPIEEQLSFDLTPLDQSRSDRHANPLLLRVYAPVGETFSNKPFMPLIEWP